MTALARDPARMKREGQAAMVAGRWKSAITFLREYLAIHPADGKVWTDLATCCEKGADGAGTLDALRGAAAVFEAEGFYEKAVATWNKLVRLAPRDAGGQMRLGENLRSLGRRADARKHYERAEAAYREAGRAAELAQVRQRLADLDAEVAVGSVTAQAPVRAGETEAWPGEGGWPWDETSAFVADRMEDARLMRRYGIFDRAITSLEQILGRFPDDREAKTLLVETLRDAGQHERAERLQAEIDVLLPVSGRIVPRPERHIPASERAPEVDSEPEPQPLLALEEDHLTPEGDEQEPTGGAARAAGESSRAADEFDWDSLLDRIELRPKKKGREFSSFEDLLESLEPSGDSPAIASGDVLEACQLFAGLPPEADERTRFDLAMAFVGMGLEDEAAAGLQVVAKGSEFRFEASFELAESFVRRGRPKEAISWYERALATPERSAAERHRVCYRLGLACEAAGELVRAFGLLLDLYTEDARFEDVAERVHNLKSRLNS